MEGKSLLLAQLQPRQLEPQKPVKRFLHPKVPALLHTGINAGGGEDAEVGTGGLMGQDQLAMSRRDIQEAITNQQGEATQSKQGLDALPSSRQVCVCVCV